MKIILVLTIIMLGQSIPTNKKLQNQKRLKKSMLKQKIQKQPEEHCNKYVVQKKSEAKIMQNYRDQDYVQCQEMTGFLGHAGIISSKDDHKHVAIKNNRVEVKVNKDRIVVFNPITELEQSNLKLNQIKALNIPLPWLGQGGARCIQIIYDSKRQFQVIEKTNSEVPKENVWDTLCFQTDLQRDTWLERIIEFRNC